MPQGDVLVIVASVLALSTAPAPSAAVRAVSVPSAFTVLYVLYSSGRLTDTVAMLSAISASLFAVVTFEAATALAAA